MMPRSRIHIRRDLIAKDKKAGTKSRVIGVETFGRCKRYGCRVTIEGPCTVVYSPSKPLSCGARAWVETYSHVKVHRAN